MRAALAATLALSLALTAAAPHVHVGAGAGGEECQVCLVRGAGEVARGQTPDVTPALAPAGAVVLAPAPSPVCGAPLGAIPGQSPPWA
jgi:hypothetical protein